MCLLFTVTTAGPTGTQALHGGTTKPVVTDSSGRPISSTTQTPPPHKVCKTGFTDWINRDRPESGNGDHEALTDAEKADRCPGGSMTRVECYAEAGDIPSYSSGEVLTCDAATGLTCNNADNFPVTCTDYKIRYYCQCPGKKSPVQTTRHPLI